MECKNMVRDARMTQKARGSKFARLAALGLAGLALAPPALAAAPAADSGPAAPVKAVLDCRSLTDGVQRLACYDAAAAKMANAESSGELVTLDRAQRQAVRREAFGLPLASLHLFDRGEKPETVNRITVTIAESWRNAEGKWLIKLDTGAVWRQIDDNSLGKPPHAGSKAEIRKGALGSFFVNIDGQLALRMHRDS